MGVRQLASVLSVLLMTSHVISFSISKRSDTGTDLSDALDILQRQRRRVTADNFYGPERLLDTGPLTLQDVSDWLSREEDGGDLDNEWLSDQGDFKSFDDEPELSSYDLEPLVMTSPMDTEPQTEVASRRELDDLFSDDDEDDNKEMNTMEKKKKEEMLNVKGEKKSVKKKSIGSDPGLSLDSLTKEEYKALMKAVEKLQRQAEKFSDASESIEDIDDVNETVLESVPLDRDEETPVSEEELTSVFSEDDKEPVIKDTKITEEAVPGLDGEPVLVKTVQTQTLPSDEGTEEALKDAIASEIEQGISQAEETEEEISNDLEALEESQPDLGMDPEKLADLEKYWLLNSYMEKNALQKRAANRAVVIPRRLLTEANDAIENVIEEQNRELDLEEARELEAVQAAREAAEEDEEEEEEEEEEEDSTLRGAQIPSVDMFLRKILQLQGEVDHLRTVARLEDLENDVLTDALNEATLGQKEGTVSALEFDSLQEAIQLEEALQDLKTSSEDNKRGPVEYSDDVIKRGEPYRRKRGPESTGRTGNTKMSMEDVERILEQAYQKEEDRENEDIASLFLRDAASCPAVREYSTNCELADLYSLPVDYEARALCNLHQMCYACGHSLRVQQDQCDFVYRAAATALCDEKEACVVESEIFLRTMKLKTRYVPHSQPKCRSTCSAEFIGMI